GPPRGQHVTDGEDSWPQRGAGNHRADGVEDSMFGVARDGGRQLTLARLNHVAREPGSDVTRLAVARGRSRLALAWCSPGSRCWESRGGNESARALENSSPGGVRPLESFHIKGSDPFTVLLVERAVTH